MTKRIVSVFLAVLLLLSAAAFSEDTLYADILERGNIVIATEGTWAPWTYHDEDGTLVGFDVEVAQKIAELLGVEAEFIDVEFDGILAGIASGRFDISANGIEYSEDRAEACELSAPYGYIHTALIVRDGDDRINTFEDLNGMKTANTLQSTYAALGEQYGAEVTGVDDLVQTMELLKAGRIDATLNADVSFYEYFTAQPDCGLHVAALTQDASLVVIPMAKGEVSLKAAIDDAIAQLMADGTIAEISIKYFGSDITKAE